MPSAPHNPVPMHFKLPNLHADWPFPRLVNPHCTQVSKDSLDWSESFRLFPPDYQAKFRQIQTGILAALCYPHHSEEHLLLGTDLNNLLVAVDDVSDVLDGVEAGKLAMRIVHCLRWAFPFPPWAYLIVGFMFIQRY